MPPELKGDVDFEPIEDEAIESVIDEGDNEKSLDD